MFHYYIVLYIVYCLYIIIYCILFIYCLYIVYYYIVLYIVYILYSIIYCILFIYCLYIVYYYIVLYTVCILLYIVYYYIVLYIISLLHSIIYCILFVYYYILYIVSLLYIVYILYIVYCYVFSLLCFLSFSLTLLPRSHRLSDCVGCGGIWSVSVVEGSRFVSSSLLFHVQCICRLFRFYSRSFLFNDSSSTQCYWISAHWSRFNFFHSGIYGFLLLI